MAGEEGVGRIPFEAALPIRVVSLVKGGLFPCFTGEDELVKGFKAPALAGNLGGQPVKEFRMDGRLALYPEIFRAGKRLSEVTLPDAVCCQSHGKGIVRTGYPFGQFLA